MQTFLPHDDYTESAMSLDNDRLQKQALETYQITCVLTGGHLTNLSVWAWTGKMETNDETGEIEPVMRRFSMPREEWVYEKYDPKGWKNHPAVRMWDGYLPALFNYQTHVVNELAQRKTKSGRPYKTDRVWAMTLDVFMPWVRENSAYYADNLFTVPPWLGDSEFHRSHQSNLIRKASDHYAPQFPGVPDDLEYIWPV